MKVHLIKKQTVEDFICQQSRSKPSLQEWLDKIKSADWKKPGDMKNTFNTADFLGNGSSRVVFNIAGNHYRMICKYVFGERQVHLFVCWIGTHAEYDKLCGKGLQYGVNVY